MAIEVDVELRVKTSKKQLEDQIKEKLKDGVAIDAQLVVTPDSIAKLSESIQKQLNNKQFTVNIGNVKLLASAKDEMKKQIETMFGYSTKESVTATKELEKQVELLQKKNAAQEAALNNAKNELRHQQESTRQAQEKAIALQKQKDILQETYNLTKKSITAAGADNLKDQLRQYKELINELNVKKEVLPEDDLAARIQGMRNLATEAQRYGEMLKAQAQAQRDANAASKDAQKSEQERESLLQKQSAAYDKLLVAMARFQNSEISTREEAKPLIEQYQLLKTTFEKAMTSGTQMSNEAVKGLIQQSDALVRDMNALRSVSSEQMKHNNLLSQAYNLYAKINSLINGYPNAAPSELKSVLQTMGSDLRSRIDSGTLNPEYVNNMKTQLGGVNDQMRTLGLLGQQGDSIIKQFFSRFSAVALITAGFYKLKSVMSDMLSHVKELDAAMTELKKVTEETDAGYNKFFDDAGERAKELGVTIADIISATADFARLGYSLSEASMLADVATIYKNVGDGIESIDTASESIISTMKAFNVEVGDAITIVDKLNEVGRYSCRAA